MHILALPKHYISYKFRFFGIHKKRLLTHRKSMRQKALCSIKLSLLCHNKNSLLCCAVLCCAVLCCAVLCCAVLCCAVLCCAVLLSIFLPYIAVKSFLLFLLSFLTIFSVLSFIVTTKEHLNLYLIYYFYICLSTKHTHVVFLSFYHFILFYCGYKNKKIILTLFFVIKHIRKMLFNYQITKMKKRLTQSDVKSFSNL